MITPPENLVNIVIYSNKSTTLLNQSAKMPTNFPVFHPNLSFGRQFYSNLAEITNEFKIIAINGDVVNMRFIMDKYSQELIDRSTVFAQFTHYIYLVS